MKKVHYIILSVLAIVMTFFACSKEVAFLDNFFKLTKSHNEVATINYQEPTVSSEETKTFGCAWKI